MFEGRLRAASVDPAGRSQVRLQAAGDDGDGVEDAWTFYSAEAVDPALRPTLRVVYQP